MMSFLLGTLLTFLLGQLMNDNIIGEFPDIRFSDMPLLGTTYWGYPLAIYKLVLYPGAFREIIWIHLVLDVVYWTILLLIIESLIGVKRMEFKVPKKRKASKSLRLKKKGVKRKDTKEAKKKMKKRTKKSRRKEE